MRIGIIGTGNVGSVLGRRWSEAGHEVRFGSRSPDDPDVQSIAGGAGADAVDPKEAAAWAEVVVVAVPGTVVDEVVRGLGNLSAKIVVDCTNPHRRPGSFREDPSTVERLAAIAPGARIVKAFNTTGAGNMANPKYPEGTIVMPICGDDADAKSVVAELAESLGFDVMDNGPLSQAPALEAMAIVWIQQAYQQGWGPNFGFAALKR